MAIPYISLESGVVLGENGFKATKVWVTDGPIALVQTTSNKGEVKSRLDLHKLMFIDPLPFQVREDGIRQIAKAVRMKKTL